MSDDRTPTDAEQAKWLAEAEAARASARKLTAEALAAEAEAELKAHELAEAREKEAARVQSDHHRRVYQFSGAVTDASVDKCLAKLRLWDRLEPTCDIEVIFNSPGGGVIAGMALFDELHRLSHRGGGSHHVTTGVAGYAASMAGILLQAGDTRWIGAQSYLMIHEISAGTGGKIGEIEDDVKFYRAICARVVDIFVNRAEGKCSKQRFVRSWKRQDWWLLAQDAHKLGFVDEIR
jgi:ATP-dependent Clp endopeptidase proteolytic subunit ClpP